MIRFELKRIGLTTGPLAIAIGVFGVVFGAAASAQFGAPLTILMSLLVFSGTVQFAVTGLLVSGAGAAAILITVAALNTRNLVMGAVLRQHLTSRWYMRALLSWFLLDESFGLAVLAGRGAQRMLLISGVLFYIAWQVGTVLGVLGAQAIGLEGIAKAIFPVLFIGLAAVTVRGRMGVVRTIAAAAIVAVATIVVPSAHAFLPIIAAVIVAIPGGRGR